MQAKGFVFHKRQFSPQVSRHRLDKSPSHGLVTGEDANDLVDHEEPTDDCKDRVLKPQE